MPVCYGEWNIDKVSKCNCNLLKVEYVMQCIFCERPKYVNRTLEKLVKATQLRVDQTLRQIATARCDQRILAITSRDIVAAEAHYHRSCYRDYTRPAQQQQPEKSEPEDAAEYDAFLDLFRFIRTDVLDLQVVITMIELTKTLESFLQTRGVEKLGESTKKHIRRKLESEFGSTLEIFPDEKGKLLVMPANLNAKETVKKLINVEKELKSVKSKSTELQSIVDQSAQHLRNVILDIKWTFPWPILPSDLSVDQFPVPGCLHRFLMGLLTSNSDMTNPSPRVKMLIESFSQDLIYAVTCGKIKPPKQILLSYGVKTLTGNVEVIRMLNRFGHGVSYSQLEENDTALCLQKLAANLNQTTILPGTIQPNVFTNLAWDNIDRLEETLTGKGTTHRVNGIAVQPRVFGPHPPPAELPPILKRKQRSISYEEQPLPMYISGERIGPGLIVARSGIMNSQDAEALKAQQKNLFWVVARQTDGDGQSVPSWTGFNVQTRSEEDVREDVVAYLPTINASATELRTVNEILRQSEDIRKRLNLDEIVVVLDQALYAKACEVAWKNRELYRNIIFRLGTFHTICNVMSIIGKRFQDAGLRDICIESGILAERSVSSVIEGKMYNRAVRIHKYIYEALMRLIWQQFIPWLTANHADKVRELRVLEVKVNDMVDEVDPKQCESNWQLHLHAIRNMIPWCFAYDKINYARYLPVYYAQMMNLPSDHPEVYSNFMAGTFSVQLAGESPFGRIPVDQTTEVTVNKDTKSIGGITKYSLKTGAVNRFYMTTEYRCSFLAHLRDMVQVKRPSYHHDDMLSTRKRKDEQAVKAVENLIANWNNPFTESKELEVGGKAYQVFREQRLESFPPQKKFHDTIKSLFGRIIIIGQNRKIEIRQLLQYSLGPLPWALATIEGFPRKTNKAVLATALQKDVQLADGLPPNSAIIIDGTSLVQKLSIGGGQTTFAMVASSLLTNVLHEGFQSNRIDVVFDTYRDVSIKNAERTMRGEVAGVHLSDISATQLVKQWRKFLSEVKNKTSLIKFISQEWRGEECTGRLRGKTLFVAAESECWKITEEGSENVAELKSNQEEADTRMLLHAAHAAQEGYEAVAISSEDTDVFILLLNFSSIINAKLFMRCGSRTRTRLVDIKGVVQRTGQEILKSDEGARRMFRELGQSWAVPEDLFILLEKFTCSMYMSVGNTTGCVNDARYELFCAKNGEVESHQLPPCQDSLQKHILRANYQAAIWKRSLEANPDIPSPDAAVFEPKTTTALPAECKYPTSMSPNVDHEQVPEPRDSPSDSEWQRVAISLEKCMSKLVETNDKLVTSVRPCEKSSTSPSRVKVIVPTFSGDPLQYPVWSSAFKALVDARDWDADTKLNLLNQYVSGGPKQVVEHYLLIGTEDAYVKAKSVLRERYGNPNVVSSAFLSKLDKWPKIAPRDSGGLREFSDFLDKVVAAREHIPSLAILDFAKENVKLLAKLPYHIESKWRDVITTWRVKNGESSYPSFLKFTDFIRAAAVKANIPELEDLSKLTSKPKMVRSPGAQAFVTSVSADRQYYKRESTDQVDRRSERSSKREQTDQVIKSEKSHKKESAGRVDQTSCFYCDKDHQLEDCEGFKEKPYSERKNFFFKKKLCLGCALTSQHQVKDCKNKTACKRCGGHHLTCLHQVKNEEGNTKCTSVCNLEDQNGTDNSMIVPVWVRPEGEPSKEILQYAVLDDQSNVSFISQSLCDRLDLEGPSTVLHLTTVQDSNVPVESNRIHGLEVLDYHRENIVKLPTLFSRKNVPADRSQIPKPEVAREWNHLQSIAEKLVPYHPDAEISLLIGSNCPRLIRPREIVAGDEDEPYGQRTLLGWGVIGRAKEILAPDVLKVLETDFQETSTKLKPFSVEDKRFLRLMEDGICKLDNEKVPTERLDVRDGPDLLNGLLGVLCRFREEKNEARRFHVYVANRVQQIREMTDPNAWMYVHTKFLWEDGPFEVKQPEEHPLSEADPEIKKVKALTTKVLAQTLPDHLNTSRFSHISNWFKAKKAVALCIRLLAKFRRR
ncbi:hypothetical protein QZH41_002637 [Actinostola sp. cb2023]|nr:hypothetical protein QZH41_002637 [Actinostola sp. cb2023]